MPEGLPCRVSDYLQPVGWAGRIVCNDKRGVLEKSIAPLPTRFNITADNWIIIGPNFRVAWVEYSAPFSTKKGLRSLHYRLTPGIGSRRLLFEGA